MIRVHIVHIVHVKERSYNWRSATIEEERSKAGSQKYVILLLIDIFGEEGQGDKINKNKNKKIPQEIEDYCGASPRLETQRPECNLKHLAEGKELAFNMVAEAVICSILK